MDTQLVLLLIHHLLIYKSHQFVFSLNSIRTNSVRFFTFPSQKRENQLIPLSRRTIFSLQYIKIDDAIAALIRLGRGTYLAKTDIDSAFRQFPVHPMGCTGTIPITLIKCYHLVYVARRIFLINFLMRLNGFFLTSVL